MTRTDRRRLLRRLDFSESRHFSWDVFPANIMARDANHQCPSYRYPTLRTLFLPPPPPLSLPTNKTPASPRRQHPCERDGDGGSAEFGRPRPTAPADAANRPSSTPPPPDGLCAAHVPTDFFPAAAATAVTELPDDVDIGPWDGPIASKTAGDGPYAAAGIVACNRIFAANASCT